MSVEQVRLATKSGKKPAMAKARPAAAQKPVRAPGGGAEEQEGLPPADEANVDS